MPDAAKCYHPEAHIVLKTLIAGVAKQPLVDTPDAGGALAEWIKITPENRRALLLAGRWVLVGWQGSPHVCRAMPTYDGWIGLAVNPDSRQSGTSFMLGDEPTHYVNLPRNSLFVRAVEPA